MKIFCLISLLLYYNTVSVQSHCLIISQCKQGLVSANSSGGCRDRLGRSIESEGCYGRDKLYVDDNILDHPGPLSTECPDGYVFDGNMQCRVEGWEPDSGPWETHHYIVRGRNLVFTLKRSSLSVRYRSLSLS